MTDIIVVDSIAKRFGTIDTVSGISFSVREGEVFGFLGPNGAGKTTTINMLIGLARADAGSIHIGGIDCSCNPRAAQRRIGVVPDESNLYPELTGFENLCFCAALYGLGKRERQGRARALLDAFGLSAAGDRRFGSYSKGMGRRLTVAAGMIHRPAILFLDEPTTGLDVASARQLRQRITELQRSGTTIFLTTHYIEEAERLCDRIAFIVSGRIVCIDRIANLLQSLQVRQAVQITCPELPDGILDRLAEAFQGLEFKRVEPDVIRVEAATPVRVGTLIRFLDDLGVEVSEARQMRPSLEDVFVHITGIEAKAMSGERDRNRSS